MSWRFAGGGPGHLPDAWTNELDAVGSDAADMGGAARLSEPRDTAESRMAKTFRWVSLGAAQRTVCPLKGPAAISLMSLLEIEVPNVSKLSAAKTNAPGPPTTLFS